MGTTVKGQTQAAIAPVEATHEAVAAAFGLSAAIVLRVMVFPQTLAELMATLR